MRTTAQIKKYTKNTQRRGTGRVLEDIRIVIESSKNSGAHDTQTHKTMLFWQIGKRIREALKKIRHSHRRTDMIQTLSQNLSAEYGKEFTNAELWRMVEFGNSFSDSRAASLLAQKLNWRHFSVLIPIRDPIKRNFYAELCRMEGWNPRELREQIRDMLYERTSMNGHITNGRARHVFKALRGEDALPSEFIYDSLDTIDL